MESDIDFFLSDYRHLDKDIRIIVQRLGSNKIYEGKCQLNHSATRGCTREYGPCECVGERSGSYQYRLKMNFSEQDGGLGTLLLTIFNYSQTTVNVQIIREWLFKLTRLLLLNFLTCLSLSFFNNLSLILRYFFIFLSYTSILR